MAAFGSNSFSNALGGSTRSINTRNPGSSGGGKRSPTDVLRILNESNDALQTIKTTNNYNNWMNSAGVQRYGDSVADLQRSGGSRAGSVTPRPTDRGIYGDYGFGATGGGAATSGGTGGGGTSGSGTGGTGGSGESDLGRDPETSDPGDDGNYGSGDGASGSQSTFNLGGTTYSALGLQTLLTNPYSLAQAFLGDLGSQYNTPTMMGAMGQFPALAGTLDLMLNGEKQMSGDMLDDAATATRLVELMRGQLTPGGGIDAYGLIQKMLNLASTETTSPGTDGNQIQSALGSLLGGISSSGAAVGSQVNTVNDLIKVAMVNSNPAMAASIAAMLDYYGNAYITQAAKVNDENPIPSYAQWLRDQGLIFR
jgi:hypothetical protein